MTTLQSDATIRSEFGLAGSPQEFLSRRTTFANPLGEFYLDSFSLPTYDRPSTGTIFGNIADKITLSAGSTEPFTGVQKAAARSVPEMVADYFQDRQAPKVQIPGSFIRQGDELVFATQDGTKPLASVRMADVWETIPELQQVAMQQAGFTKDTLSSIGINTAEDFAGRWPEILLNLRARERVDVYKREAPVGSAVASGTSFVSQIIDPTLLLTLGATAVLKTAAVTAVKQGAKSAARQSLRGATREAVEASLTNTATRAATLDRMAVMASDGIVGAMARSALSQERSAAARMLLLPTGAAYGAGIGTLSDVGDQLQGILMGARDPADGVELHGGPALIGGLIGLAFGEFAYRMTGASMGPLTNNTYLGHGPDNFAKFALETRRGFVYYGGEFAPRTSVDPRWADQTVDVQGISDLEFIEDAVASLYNPDIVQEFSGFMPEIAKDPAKAQDFADFLRGYPTPAEVRAVLSRQEGPSALDLGNLPITEIQSLNVRLADLEVRAREAATQGKPDLARSLRKEYAKLSERRAYLLTDQLALSPTAETKNPEVQRYFLNNKFQVPITSIPDSGIRVQQIEKRLVNTINAAGKETYTRRLIPYMRRGLNKIGADYRNPIGSLRAFMTSASDRARFIALEATGLTNRGFVYNEVLRDANGKAVLNTFDELERFKRDLYEPVSQLNHKLSRGLSEQEKDALWVDAWRHATSLETATGPAAELGDSIAAAVKRYGQEGTASGYLPNLLENFAPNYWKHDAPAEAIEVFRTTYIEKRMSQYADEGTTDIHFNTLVYMGYLKKDGGVYKPTDTAPPLSKKIIDRETGELAALPTSFSELPDNVQFQYLTALPRAIELEADLVIQRRSARSNNAGEIDPDEEFKYQDLRNPAQAEIVRSFSLDTATRKLEQDILFDRRVLESGLVDLDPSTVMMLYNNRSGYNIARQKALTARYGEYMPYQEYKQALQRLAQGDEEAKAALEMFEFVESSMSHRYRMDRQGLGTTVTLSNIVAGTANMGTPVAQLAFEAPMVGALVTKSLTSGRRAFSALTTDIAYAFKGLLDERRGRLDGFIKSFETAPSRFVADMGRNLPLKVRNNRFVRASKWYADATRAVSGEKFLTNLTRSLVYDRAYGKMWAFSKKLDRLKGLQKTFDDPAAKAGAARAAGMSLSELDEFRFHGLLEDDMLDIASELVTINPNALERRDELRSAILGLSAERKPLAEELDRRLTTMAVRATDAIIATPSPADRLVAENNIMKLLSAFTGWANAFQNQTMSRLASSAYHEHIAFLGVFIAGDVAVGIMRDILYNGLSPEAAVEKWNEQPAQSMALIVSRMPFFGAFNPVMLGIQGIAASQSNGVEDLTNAPALQMVGRVTRSLKQASTDIYNGDSVRPSVMRTLEKYSPPMNMWYSRLLDTYLREGFEGDSDR